MAASTFVREESVHGLGRKRIAGNAVDRIGGNDDALTRPQCLQSAGPTLFPRARVRRIDNERAHIPSVVCRFLADPGRRLRSSCSLSLTWTTSCTTITGGFGWNHSLSSPVTTSTTFERGGGMTRVNGKQRPETPTPATSISASSIKLSDHIFPAKPGSISVRLRWNFAPKWPRPSLWPHNTVKSRS